MNKYSEDAVIQNLKDAGCDKDSKHKQRVITIDWLVPMEFAGGSYEYLSVERKSSRKWKHCGNGGSICRGGK